MKKLLLVASVATFGLAFTAFRAPTPSTTMADSSFEGVVTYSMTTDNAQAQSMMSGSTMKVYLKGDKSKTLMDMGMSKTIVFADHKTPDDPIILVEIMGNKYQLKLDKTKQPKEPTIKYTDETKTIAGYVCKKAEVTSTDEQGQTNTSNVYYTEELPAYSGRYGQFKGLKGFPLEFSMKQRGMNLSLSATKVDKQSVSDDTFTVPSGYKAVTQEEMMQDIQKNMGGGGGN